VAVNELFEIIFYDEMVAIVQHPDTNAFLYFAAKDSLLLLCLLYFCLNKEAELSEEPPTERFMVAFGFMILLNMNIHICVQTGMYNFIFDNYQNIYMGMQIPLCVVLSIGVDDGFNSTKRGLYE